MLEAIVSTENLNQAYKRVKKNKGAGGVDGMKVDELLQYLIDNGEEIRQTILVGKYRPDPVRRVEIPKENGKTRKLGIPTAVDRVIYTVSTARAEKVLDSEYTRSHRTECVNG